MRSAWIKIAFVIPVLWWVYLFFITQFTVVYDAEGFEQTAKVIAYHGWAEFFRNGLQREPMFLGLVALSMRLGDWWGCSYDYPLKLIGCFYLFLTMIFSYRLMRMLSVRPIIIALVIFYIGISPVMTNSSMRLWSEFATYPWVVLAVIWTIKSWKLLENAPQDRRGYFRIVKYALILAFLFLLIMFVKAVAEGILILFLWPFYWQILSYWRSGNLIKSKQMAVFCLVVLILFESVVGMYKWCNYHYNGNYAFTNRGSWLVYGSTVRRIQPLTLESLGAALAYVPGMGLCTSIYSQEDCQFWSGEYVDGIWGKRLGDLSRQGIVGNAANNYFIDNSIRLVITHPLQVFLLMVVEAQKMFFWESSIDFVTYPNWLDNVLHTPGFSYSLRIIFAILSWIACVFAFYLLCFRSQKYRFKDNDQKQTLFWIVNFIFWYIWMFSWVHILDRFSFPLIALFMVLIAFLLDSCISFFIPNSSLSIQNTGKIEGSSSFLLNKNIFSSWKQYPGWIIISFLAITQVVWYGIAPENFKSIWSESILVAQIIKEHNAVEQKSKFVTLSYSTPNFDYLSQTVTGNLQLKTAMSAGYPDYYKEAVALFPDVDSLHYLLGFCEYYRAKADLAREQFEESVDLNPDFFWSYYNLGVIYFDQGNYFKSALILNKALSLSKETTLVDVNQNPFYWQIWRNIDNPGQVLEGNFSEGIDDAALLMAASISKQGMYDQAFQVIQSVGKASPWHQNLWKQLLIRVLNKQPINRVLDKEIKEQVQVRLF